MSHAFNRCGASKDSSTHIDLFGLVRPLRLSITLTRARIVLHVNLLTATIMRLAFQSLRREPASFHPGVETVRFSDSGLSIARLRGEPMSRSPVFQAVAVQLLSIAFARAGLFPPSAFYGFWGAMWVLSIAAARAGLFPHWLMDAGMMERYSFQSLWREPGSSHLGRSRGSGKIESLSIAETRERLFHPGLSAV
jgi:hypothetical protein